MTFVDQVKLDSRTSNGDQDHVPGILYLDSNHQQQQSADADALPLLKKAGPDKKKNGCLASAGLVNGNCEEDTKILEPKEELQYLAEALGFQVTYTDFPQKATAKSEFITLVKLSTKPPKVCHGKGTSREASQTDAARRALVLLADSGDIEDSNDNDNDNFENPDNLVNGINKADEIPVVSAAAAAEETTKTLTKD